MAITPFGLVPVRYLNGAAWTGQTNTYYITGGNGATYANNIFIGDPVLRFGVNYAATNGLAGYIGALPDADGLGTPLPKPTGGFNYTVCPSWGVLVGVSYQQPFSANPSDPANPGRPFWPASSVIVPNSLIKAAVVDDPNVIFQVCSNSYTGLTQADVGKHFAFNIPVNVGTSIVTGNFQTGQSMVGLDAGSAVTQGVPQNYPASQNVLNVTVIAVPPETAGTPNNIVEVIFNNHAYVQRSPLI